MCLQLKICSLKYSLTDEVCYKREISYRGDELEELRKGSVTQETIDFRYAYRNPNVCYNRCREYP